MAITIRNIDATENWDNTKNPHSCRVNYTAGSTAAEILAGVDTFLCGHFVTAPADAYNGTGDTVIRATGVFSTDTPATGNLKIYDVSEGTFGSNIAYTSRTISATYTEFTVSALAGDLVENDRIFVVGHVGDTGWGPIATANSPVTVRSYKQANTLSTVGTAYKYMILDAASTFTNGAYLQCKVYTSVTGTTGTSLAGGSATTDNGQRLSVGASGVAGDVFVSAGIGWFMMVSAYYPGTTTVGSVTNSASSGIVEFDLVHPQGTASMTPYLAITGAAGSVILTGIQPPDSGGFINSSSNATGILTSQGMFGYSVGGAVYQFNTASGILARMVATDNFTSKTKATSMYYYSGLSSTSMYAVGPILNLQIVGAGTYGDTAVIKVTDGLISITGQDTDHILFPLISTACWAVPK